MQKSFAATLAKERLLGASISASIRENTALNVAIETLFDLSACSSHCRGGDHVIERLLGRLVNQALASIIVDAAGLHDEALGTVRSIGEITNLLALFRLDPPMFRIWASATDPDRRKNFSPVKVRIAIESRDTIAIPMDQATYDRMCSDFVHVNPDTSPNSRGPDGAPHVGGHWQSSAAAEFEEVLTYTVLQAAMIASSMFDRLDHLGVLTELARKQPLSKLH